MAVGPRLAARPRQAISSRPVVSRAAVCLLCAHAHVTVPVARHPIHHHPVPKARYPLRKNAKADARPAFVGLPNGSQAFGACAEHQPVAFTSLPGNSWHGPHAAPAAPL